MRTIVIPAVLIATGLAAVLFGRLDGPIQIVVAGLLGLSAGSLIRSARKERA